MSLRRSSRNKKRSVSDLQNDDAGLEKKTKIEDQSNQNDSKSEPDGYDWLTKHNFTYEKLKPFGLIIHSSSTDTVITEIEPAILHKLCWENSFVVLRGFKPLEDDKFIQAAETFGPILKWEFGEIMHVKQVPKPKTSVTSHEHVPFHFDGMFFKIPSYQLFQCTEAPDPSKDPGGETTFCNSVALIKEAPKEKVELWKKAKLGFFTAKSDYFGGFKAIFDLIEKHPHTGELILRYHEPWENDPLQPVVTTYEGAKPEDGGLTAEQLAEIHKDLTELLYDPRYCFKQQWHVGDYLLTDNNGQLHGRTAFKEDSPRHLKRIHIGPNLDVKEFVEIKRTNQNDAPAK
mmetsp:Transcript_4378/g.6136  ORF Transcript_4378/g.6136 Transcript_4378/m.6136 type:complete len:344 (-) Transcript_4378:125-1156(-)